ncbi:MAG: T9SS type A sorting domain-containing protein [Saprospiraceae bacterium]|nr:T9SS type A sorting domain-containing protein [Candidatus Vicinibacter affinis]
MFKSKIIIPSNASLTLINSILTSDTKVADCPILVGNWEGIFIKGGSGVTFPGGPPSPSGGSFSATESSIIEHSNKGIQAEKGHLGITISNSIMRLNRTAINAGGLGGLVYGGTINITSSTISNTSGSPEENLIKANGCNLNITGSTLTNLSSKLVTGIKAFNNRVSIKSTTTIQGFVFGVDKEMSGGLAGLQGLTIENSRFLDGTNNNHISIRNRGGNVTAKKNWIGGRVDASGKCNGYWYGNNFRKLVYIDNPAITHKFSENNFFESNMELTRNQSLTDATCNRFESTGQAVNGKATSIKSAWGTELLSSGNLPIPYASQPIMEINQSNQITHYHFKPASEPDEPFLYYGQFRGLQATNENTGCLYNVFPVTSGVVGGSGEGQTYNDVENIAVWAGFNTLYQDFVSQLASAPPASIPQIQMGIENAQVGMQLAVLEALNNSGELSSESYSVWLARADVIFSQYGQMMNMFCSDSYAELVSYLNGLSLSGEEATDKSNMVAALGWMQTAIAQGKSLFQLKGTDLAIVADMASETFGNYTTLLRSFLNIYYDIRIDPSQELNQNSRKEKSIKKYITVNFLIVPNPVEDCFDVRSTDGINRPISIILYDMSGRVVLQKNVVDSKMCLNGKVHSGIYMARINDADSRLMSLLKLMIK